MKIVFPEKTGALCAKMDRGLSGQDAVNGMILVFDTIHNNELDNILTGGAASTLMARDYKSVSDIVVEEEKEEKNKKRKYIVRRLTPLECCRLQGFPDWWEDGVEGSDSARYKMWGNGIALPCAVDVLGRIAKELRNVDENNQM